MNKYVKALDWLEGNIDWIDHIEFPVEYQYMFRELLVKEITKTPGITVEVPIFDIKGSDNDE